MTLLVLPALRGDDPLGFLAALGVLEVATAGLGLRATLGWGGGDLTARIDVDGAESVEELAERLAGWARMLDASGSLLHPELDDLPLRRHGISGADPMRLHPDAARALAWTAARDEREGGGTRAQWVGCLVNQCAVRSDSRHEQQVDLTPLYAPAGLQSVTSIFEKPLEAVVRDPAQLLHALTSWRRVQGYAGAGLDYRAERDATVLSDGDNSNFGTPGPEWLALMGLPLYRLTGDGRRGSATLWQRVRIGRRWNDALVWPVWEPMLDPAAVRCLIEHPILRVGAGPAVAPRSARLQDKRTAHEGLQALGMLGVFLSTRRSLGKSAGPLGPAAILWPE